MTETRLSNYIYLDNRSLNPSKYTDEIFEVYTLPSFDNSKKPEIKKGSEIKAINSLVSDNTILFNKLNVKFNRIWNIENIENKNSVCSSEFLRLKPQNCDQSFLYYFLSSHFIRNYLMKASGGSSGSHSRISSEDLLSIRYKFPELTQQKSIASILRLVDDKISINIKLNEQLKKLSRLLFEYWFLQFDFPDQNSLPYRQSGGEMNYNSHLKKHIPADWSAINITSLLKESKNGDWGNDTVTNDNDIKIFCIRGADINSLNGIGKLNPPRRFIAESHSDRLLVGDDLIIEISGGSPTQSTGRMAHIGESVLGRFNLPLVCSNFCKAITLKDKRLSYLIEHHWNLLYEAGVFFNYEGKTSGIKNLQFDQAAKDIYLALPNNNRIINDYYEVCSIIDNSIQNNLLINSQLEDFKTWLLPNLINQQIKIRN